MNLLVKLINTYEHGKHNGNSYNIILEVVNRTIFDSTQLRPIDFRDQCQNLATFNIKLRLKYKKNCNQYFHGS